MRRADERVMKISYPAIIAALAISAFLANPVTTAASEKRQPAKPPTIKEKAAAFARAESMDARREHLHMNDGGMSNSEVAAVAALLAARRQRQDEDTKQYELFKFTREILLAKASAPNITVEYGFPAGESERPETYSPATASRHQTKALDRSGGFARVAAQQYTREAAPYREAAPERAAAAEALSAPGAGQTAPAVVDQAVRQLMTYPAKYFRKLAMEQDNARGEDAEAKKQMLDFMAGDRQAPIMVRGEDEKTGMALNPGRSSNFVSHR